MPAIVLFDGGCGLCNGWVQFLLARDHRHTFRFAALQSEAGQRMLRERGIDERDAFSSMVLLDGARVYQRSAAVLETLRRLGGAWSLATLALWLPVRVRDWIYDFIASRRYQWFGRLDTCRVPTAAERARFLEDPASIDAVR